MPDVGHGKSTGQGCSGIACADTSALPEVWKCLLFSVHRGLVCLSGPPIGEVRDFRNLVRRFRPPLGTFPG